MSLWLTHPLFLPSLIVGVTIVLWATSLLPEFITALLFFAAAMMAKIAPPEVSFGGFASSAFWLVFSGFVLASPSVKPDWRTGRRRHCRPGSPTPGRGWSPAWYS